MWLWYGKVEDSKKVISLKYSEIQNTVKYFTIRKSVIEILGQSSKIQNNIANGKQFKLLSI